MPIVSCQRLTAAITTLDYYIESISLHAAHIIGYKERGTTLSRRTLCASTLIIDDWPLMRKMMKHILFVLVAICCCNPSFAQDHDQVFDHAVTDTVLDRMDTVNIGASTILIFETITLDDTNAAPSQLEYFQVINIFDPAKGNIVQEIPDSGHSHHEIEFIDINSDRYEDLMIHEDDYNLLQPSNVWLFKPQENRFQYSEELSGLSELSSGNDGTITSQSLSLGGTGGGYSKYRFEHDTLVTIEDVYSDRFDYEKKVLVDGEMETVELDRSDHGGDIQTVTSKRMVSDSLRIVNKRIIKDAYGMDLTTVNKEAILGEPFGTYILLEEHEYEYKKTHHGKFAVHETIKKLVNNIFKTTTKDSIDR